MDNKTVVSAAAPVKAAGAPAPASVATPVKAPAFRLQSMEQRNLTRWLKILIYGEYGIGKTTLAGTSVEVPQMNDVILLNIESGDMSISSMGAIEVATASNFSTASRVHEFLKIHCALRDADDEAGLLKLEAGLRATREKPADAWLTEWQQSGYKAKRFRTCIVDSLTEMDAMSMNRILGVKDSTPLDQDTNVAEWADFRQNYNLMQRLIRTYRDLPMNVIFICASTYNQDEMKRMNYAPLLTGKLSGQVQGFVDVVGYMKMEQAGDKMVRRMYVQPVGRFAAKCRFAEYKKPAFDDPTMGSILKAVGLLQPN